MTVDRRTIQAARQLLTPDELDVWLTKYVADKGRRSGSVYLGITEDAWRYRLANAKRKLAAHHAEQETAA